MDIPQENLLTDFEEPNYQYVGFWPRFGARLIDSIILRILGYVLSFISAGTGSILIFTTTSLIPFLYHPFMEYRFGASIGKMALRINVVTYEFQKPGITNVILRNIMYGGLELISILFSLFYFYRFREADDSRSIGSLFTSVSDGVNWWVIYAFTILALVIVEIICLVTDEKHRALHDRIGKTYVVRNTY